MNDKFLSLLGIARRAGRLMSGHDAVKEAVRGSKANLIIFTTEASQRLRDEFQRLSEGKNITLLNTEYTINDIYSATGGRAAVSALTDTGFSQRLIELYEEKHKEV